MNKLWAGDLHKALDSKADDFNSSIKTDSRMYSQDIRGSVAHATMLGAMGIIPKKAADEITEGLLSILDDLDSGKLQIDQTAEDIHTFIEGELTARIGEPGKMLHTARSRNDQVATDLRIYLRDQAEEVSNLIKEVLKSITKQASENEKTIMPGYTHLQRAQPISFAHHLLAYGMMFTRDLTRLQDCVKRMNQNPLGCCALAGTTYHTDRYMTAHALGFDGIMMNSLDGVSDRDYCIELLSTLSTIMMHLSRFSEEIILWASWEFKFVQLDDSFTTGSSIMPQKKNPDIAELVRGKTGRVYGDLVTILTMLKGLSLAYNKDMQEDKEAVFDAVDTVKMCLTVFAPMLSTMKAIPENMLKAAGQGFINATDLADYLTVKGIPFRTAYKITGDLVSWCMAQGITLDQVPMEKYKESSDLIEDDIYSKIDLAYCVASRTSEGGPSSDSIHKQIEYINGFIK